jgi:hypothetical protein
MHGPWPKKFKKKLKKKFGGVWIVVEHAKVQKKSVRQ